MEIQIRKSTQQVLNSNYIRLEAKLIDYSADITECFWSFYSDNPNVLLKHSGNILEGRFLNYYTPDAPETRFNPLMEITLPNNDIHTIRVTAETHIPVTKEVTLTKIDANDNPYDVVEVMTLSEKTITTSNPITIKKFTDEDGWR